MACKVKNSFTHSIHSYWAPLSKHQVLNLRGVAPAVSAYRAAGKQKYTGLHRNKNIVPAKKTCV